MYPITADSSYSIQPFQLSRLGDSEKKKKKSTNTLRSLDLGDLLLLKNVICTKSPQPPLSLGVHRIVHYSCYYWIKALLTQVTPQLTGWRHEAWWTLEKESVLWWQIPQQLCLHEHLLHAEVPGNSAHCTPVEVHSIKPYHRQLH